MGPTSAGPPVAEAFLERAAELDRADPLASCREEFLEVDGVIAYLDGNSLGRPLRVTGQRLSGFVHGIWADRLIRAWDEGWMDAPTELGDVIARVTLGAAPGQTLVGDSTSVLLYKLIRAGVGGRPGRDVIIVDAQDFPTDRFIVEGIAAELGMEIRAIDSAPAGGVTVQHLGEVLDARVAMVVPSHVSFRSARIADMAAITQLAHAAGALMLWDLSHSAGAVELELDRNQVDLAVGCTYKYLNGGPG
ncbi:MAG TPA: aminotransferase class V-fold PLP-dependent enzyme, partial [Solirubrobacteraceae bacterium]|nr:aminotransferase class V-fold PLP-dependent enzyme [Solirubrobacteraceae bacterium]